MSGESGVFEGTVKNENGENGIEINADISKLSKDNFVKKLKGMFIL